MKRILPFRFLNSPSISLGIALLAATLLLNPYASAGTVSWLGGDGLWTTAANWSTEAVPAGGDDVTIGTASTTTYDRANSTLNLNSFTIGSPATLLFNSASLTGVLSLSGFSNSGLLNNTGNGEARINLVADSITYTNSGTIQSSGTGGITLSANGTNTTFKNTGGAIQATGNGVVTLKGGPHATNPGMTILEGTLSTSINAQIRVRQDTALANNKTTFRDVTFNNAGSFVTEQIGFGSSDRYARTIVTGTSAITNTGAILVRNLNTQVNQTSSTASFILTGTATISNSGTITLQNAPTTGVVTNTTFEILEQGSIVNGASSAINILNTVTSGSATFTTNRDFTLTQGALNITGNASKAGAALIVSDVSKKFIQNGGTTTLASGGKIVASALEINSGTLRGEGSLEGNSLVASSALLEAGNYSLETLEIVGSLTLAGTYRATLAGNDSSSLLKITSNLNISDATLDLTALDGTLQEGSFTVIEFGTLGGSGFAQVLNPTHFTSSIDYGSQSVVVTLTAIPEPSETVIMLLGLFSILSLSRKGGRRSV